MSEQQHPRYETQVDRDNAYKDLAKLVKRTVFRHGTEVRDPQSTFIEDRIKIVTLIGVDQREIDLVHLVGIDRLIGAFTVLSVAKMHDEHVLGKQTEYQSNNGGPFVRTDSGGHSMGVIPLEGTYKNPLIERIDTLFAIGQHVHAVEENIAAGIDGLPISALETRDLIRDIEQSTPKVQPSP